MTEIPEYLLKRTKAAREKAERGRDSFERDGIPYPSDTQSWAFHDARLDDASRVNTVEEQNAREAISAIDELAGLLEKTLGVIPDGELLNLGLDRVEGRIRLTFELSDQVLARAIVGVIKGR